MSTPVAALVFLATAAVVAVAGTALSRAGDEIAERTGLGRLFVGMLLVAGATSLPEIATDVTASIAGAPDLAVGDLFGSSMANMAILAVIDLMVRRAVWPSVEVGHARVASVAIGLTTLATLAMITPRGTTLGWVGLDTLVIFGAYVAAVAWMRRSPIGRFHVGEVMPVPTGWADEPDTAPLLPLVLRFAGAAAAILVAAPMLALAARDLAEASGLGESFVGTSLVAVTTSLPELVASIAAVRIGSPDLAVGNLFGSNAFNMAALLFADVAYTDGPLLKSVDPSLAVSGLVAILLMAFALAAIVHGEQTHARRLEPDALLLLAAYGGGLYAVWSVSG